MRAFCLMVAVAMATASSFCDTHTQKAKTKIPEAVMTTCLTESHNNANFATRTEVNASDIKSAVEIPKLDIKVACDVEVEPAEQVSKTEFQSIEISSLDTNLHTTCEPMYITAESIGLHSGSTINVDAILAIETWNSTIAVSKEECAAHLVDSTRQNAVGISRANEEKKVIDNTEWYNSTFAPSGSRMWAIMQRAKVAKKNGEDITELHKLFIKSLQAYLLEE